MTSTRSYWIAAVFLVSLILRGQGTGFAETGEDRIYWADMEGIYWSNLGEGTTQRIITSDTRRPGKIAVDVAGGKIYWVDRRGGTIQWSDLDGSNSEILFELGSFAIDLDLDLEREKIYFSAVYSHGDYTDGEVYRSDLDGSDTELLLADPVGSPILALDPTTGEVHLAHGRYMVRLDPDGSSEYWELVYEPGDIALDGIAGKVYWTDPLHRAIRRSNRDGSGVEDIVTGLEDQPLEIALDREEGKVYWSVAYDGEAGHGGLRRANLDGSEVEHVVKQGEVVGITLDLERSKLYWTDARGTIRRSNLDGSGVEDLFAPWVRAPYAVALDAKAGRIYWTDLLSATVQRSGLNGSGHEILVGGLDVPKGVSLGEDRIYWADSGTGKIQSAKLDGSDMEDIVADLNQPDKVALDLAHGRIYWTEPNGRRIGRAALDGSELSGFSVDALPQGIALDVSGGAVYWTWDDQKGSTGIRRSSLEGTDVEDLVTTRAFEVYKAIALDPVGGKIHWTTVFIPPGLGLFYGGADAQVGIRGADLDGSNAAEPAWLYNTWLLTGFKVDPFEFMGSFLALDLSHRTAVSTRNSVPISTTLRRNHPNPFNGSTLISYTLAAPGPVSLIVYNTLGQPVRTLVDQVQAPGLYSVPWQPAEALASGVYLYRLTTSDAVLTRRLTLLR